MTINVNAILYVIVYLGMSQHVGLCLFQAFDMQLSATNPPWDGSSYTLCGMLKDVSCHVTAFDQIYLSYT